MGVPSLAVGAVLNVVLAPDRLGQRLAGFGLLGAAYLAMSGLVRWPRTARRAPALAAGFMLVLAAGLIYLLAQSPGDLDVLTGPVTCVMIGSTLLFPWGAGAQGIVSGALALGFAALLFHEPALAGMRATNVGISLGASVALSVIGALVLERSRRMAFNEHQRMRALATQRRRLIDIGRDLRTTLSADDIAPRLVAHAARLIPADGVLLALHDAATGRCRVVATAGDPRLQPLVDIEWDPAFAGRLAAAFASSDVRESPGGPLDPIVAPVLEPLGMGRALAAAIGSQGDGVRLLAWTRLAGVPFTSLQRTAAQGIADQACTALAAARLYETAAHASRLKSEFVSTMSHELRTPLNVIMGYNQMLSDTLPPAPETTHALDAVRRASVELLDLVEATLDLGRLEAGRETVREETVAARDLLDELAREFAPLPRPAGVALTWDAGENPVLSIDRRKLKTILKNLVGNALKFTPAGNVRVECRSAGSQARFRVIDTGVGIRPEDQAAVFEMFRQADSSDTRRYGGAGLGLYIVRRLVRVLGGSVGLESSPGRGSTFTVTVPLAGATGGRQRSAA